MLLRIVRLQVLMVDGSLCVLISNLQIDILLSLLSSLSSSLLGLHHFNIHAALLAANNLQTGMSSASPVASSIYKF